LDTRSELHALARSIFNSALAAVDARVATHNAIKINQGALFVLDSQLSSARPYVVAIGKAALSMAMGVADSISDHVAEGIVVSPKSSEPAILKNWRLLTGGHPLPDRQSLDSARAIFELLARANAERASIIFLISGGGSAMVEMPIDERISLDDLQKTNQILVTSGASIFEINVVRRAFSAVKGGGLARAVPDAQVITLIISDTNQGDESSVASGPTLVPPVAGPGAMEVVSRYRLEYQLPTSVLNAIAASGQPQQINSSPYYVLLQNRTALEAAARTAGANSFESVIDDEICEQPVQRGCELLLDPIARSGNESRSCLISGGEFSCPVTGNGTGGRNLETVLRCAIEMDSNPPEGEVVVLSCGTDGIDGNSPAAGAIADMTTIARAREVGLDAYEYLSRSDSYSFFRELGDVIVTGPTGTNVRDLRIILQQK
jgi:hydroxypyruvate reductase